MYVCILSHEFRVRCYFVTGVLFYSSLEVTELNGVVFQQWCKMTTVLMHFENFMEVIVKVLEFVEGVKVCCQLSPCLNFKFLFSFGTFLFQV